jgi:predicted TIM-barrel fold metal-dependent hydrolase
MMIRRPALCALAVVAAGCAPAARTAAPAPDAGPLAPLVDYHQHLVSPAGAALLNEQNVPAPAVEVPAEIAVLLRQRAERWNDRAGLAELYTERSMMLGFESEWVRGRDAVAQNASRRFGRPLRLTPIAYQVQGSTAWVTGYFTRGEGAAARHFGLFHLALERDVQGPWRIAVETPTFPGPEVQDPITAEQLVAQLDAAGIRRAVVLSDAYWFDSPRYNVTDELPRVRAENDWTAEQVARFPDRLVGFCSFNPLREYALPELERCAADGRFRGVKLHFGMSGVDLRDPAQVAKVRQVFQAANRLGLAIIAHIRADTTYGRPHAEVLLNQLVAAAPDVPVQIAHLWGGEGYSESALAYYAEAVAAGHPATRNLYFDVADLALVIGGNQETLATLAARMRQIGLERILYGSDAVGRGHPTPREAWRAFHGDVPLTEAEFRAIADNVAPYLR